MLRNQNIIVLIRISEYQKSLVNLKQAHQYVDHGIVQDPSKPSAKLLLRSKDLIKQYVLMQHLQNSINLGLKHSHL